MDRIVVITGAGGGLGSALASGFAREGAELVLADVDAPALERVARELTGEGATCSTHRLDLTVESEIHAFSRSVCARHSEVHVLINNAGLAYGEINNPLESHSQAAWLRFFALNSVAPLLLATGLRPALAKGQGVIINQSSMASYVPATPYGVTKATLNSMTYGMAHRFAEDGIRVNAIAPGLMETPASNQSLPDQTRARIQAMQLLKLHGTPDDIVNLALFLASDDARFITNEVVHCDAGNQIRGWRG